MARYDPTTGSRILWEPSSAFDLRVWRGPELVLAKAFCGLLTSLFGLFFVVAGFNGLDVMAPAFVVAGREVPFAVALLFGLLLVSGSSMCLAIATASAIAVAKGYSR